MKAVTIYTTPGCGSCFAAKHLLRKKGVTVDEIDIAAEPGRRAEMVQRAGGRTTTPQIFLGDSHLGGFSDIANLDWEGRLDRLLAGD
jgi:glutaredoxin 3